MYLLFITTFLSFLSASTSAITKPILKWVNRPTEKEQMLLREMTELQETQSQISMIDNFASHAKLQRKINSLKNELTNTAKERAGSNYFYNLGIAAGIKMLIFSMMFYVVVSYRYVPVYTFPSNFSFFPVSSIISYPNQIPGSVSVHFWMIVTNCVARQVIK